NSVIVCADRPRARTIDPRKTRHPQALLLVCMATRPRVRGAPHPENANSASKTTGRHRAWYRFHAGSWDRVHVATTIGSLIASAERGDHSAADALFAALYSELHRLAGRQLASGGAGLSLGTTTLLHEAYLNMSQREGTSFPDRARFMAYAAKVMRRL